MAYLTLENFKYGLDTRRSELASQPGTLAKLINAHVNQGGEVEKRLAFVPYSRLSLAVDSNGDRGLYGMQDVYINNVAGVAFFGSALPYGTLPTQNQPTIAIQLLAPIYYFQLQHPTVAAGGNYDRTKHRVVAITASSVYGGLPWCAARFSDGLVFCYFNGALIPSSYVGKVFDGLTATTDVANAIVAALHYYFDDAGYTINLVGSSITITAPSGDTFSQDLVVTSAAGTITKVHLYDNFPGVAGKSATAWLKVFAIPTPPGQVDKILVPDPADLANTIDILNNVGLGPVTANTPSAMVAALVARINAVAASGYSAVVTTGTTVTIAAPLSLGDAVNNMTFSLQWTGDIVVSYDGMALACYLNYYSASISGRAAIRGTRFVAKTSNGGSYITATGIGGTSPYIYRWHKVSGDDGIICSNPNLASTQFYGTVKPRQTLTAVWSCTVTDSNIPQNSTDSGVVTITIRGL